MGGSLRVYHNHTNFRILGKILQRIVRLFIYFLSLLLLDALTAPLLLSLFFFSFFKKKRERESNKRRFWDIKTKRNCHP